MPKPDAMQATFGRNYRVRQHTVARRRLHKRIRRHPQRWDPIRQWWFEASFAMRELGSSFRHAVRHINRVYSSLRRSGQRLEERHA